MEPKHTRKSYYLIILITLFFIKIPSFLCQDSQYRTCNQTFRCGNIRDIGYPFYGENRSSYCGYRGFDLTCRSNPLLINIASLTYQVLAIDNTTLTLRVARQDVSANTCPVRNTTLDFQIFDYYSNAKDQNITLYYSCQQLPTGFYNQYTCSIPNGAPSSGFFFTGGSQLPPLFSNATLTCRGNIFVPVNETSASDLALIVANPTISPSRSNVLVDALASGFSIVWSANDSNCRDCVGSGGVCGYDQSTSSFACYCSHQPYALTCNNTGNGNGNGEKLGQGGFGTVYKGVLPDGRLVAVKVLKETEGNGEEFINLVASISRTSHVNIVNLLGFCCDRNKRALVYEFMPNKSLDNYINNDTQLERKKLYEIAIGVARGLEYLHRGCNARIVHFDIKPQNILLDEEFRPKISDFGLAKLYQNKPSVLTSVFGARGTIGYIAPEVFCRNFGAISHKSDVYSYGMMVLEMAGAKKIEESAGTKESRENHFPDKIYEQEIVCWADKHVEVVTCKDEAETLRKMFLIGFWCIQTVPSNRPSMSKVVEMFEGSVESIQIPPKPFMSSA